MNFDRLDPNNTLVIADFDGTLTQKIIDDKLVPSLMSILATEKYLGVPGVIEYKSLFEYYYPKERDPHLNKKEKFELMCQWWSDSFALFVKSKVNIKQIHEICHLPSVQFRPGLIKFLNRLHQDYIPLIIYSASGVGYDSIEYLLNIHNLLTSNIKICSNDLIFDAEGNLDHVKPPIIRGANKTGDTLVNNHFLDQKPPQRQCLLIGDSLDDARMAEGLDFDSVYKVAFGDPKIPEFDNLYNLVLPIDGGYDKIIQLFPN